MLEGWSSLQAFGAPGASFEAICSSQMASQAEIASELRTKSSPDKWLSGELHILLEL